MLFRLFQIILTVFAGRFQEIIATSSITFAEQLFAKGKKILFILISCFALVILFTAGTIISVLEASVQYDSRGNILFTGLLTSGLVMAGISALLLAIIFWPRKQTPLTLPTQATAHATGQHSLEEILTVMISESIKFFKNKTEQAKAHPSEPSQA